VALRAHRAEDIHEGPGALAHAVGHLLPRGRNGGAPTAIVGGRRQADDDGHPWRSGARASDGSGAGKPLSPVTSQAVVTSPGRTSMATTNPTPASSRQASTSRGSPTHSANASALRDGGTTPPSRPTTPCPPTTEPAPRRLRALLAGSGAAWAPVAATCGQAAWPSPSARPQTLWRRCCLSENVGSTSSAGSCLPTRTLRSAGPLSRAPCARCEHLRPHSNTPAPDETRASTGARSAPASRPHLWKGRN
jgi:hypothetical protein